MPPAAEFTAAVAPPLPGDQAPGPAPALRMPYSELGPAPAREPVAAGSGHAPPPRRRGRAQPRPAPLARSLPAPPMGSHPTGGYRPGGADARCLPILHDRRAGLPGWIAAGWTAAVSGIRLLGTLPIHFYRWCISPAKAAIFGPGVGCRFTPSCSAYALEAIERYGLCRGFALSLRRVLRCHPWGGCGWDPVPPRMQKGLSLAPSHPAHAARNLNRPPSVLAPRIRPAAAGATSGQSPIVPSNP